MTRDDYAELTARLRDISEEISNWAERFEDENGPREVRSKLDAIAGSARSTSFLVEAASTPTLNWR